MRGEVHSPLRVYSQSVVAEKGKTEIANAPVNNLDAQGRTGQQAWEWSRKEAGECG